MRGQIIDAVFERMDSNPEIFFLVADMGINLVEKIEARHPTRFLNVGIAEQNLIGVAAGLANLGYRPFVYTISNFVIHRCFEQIRNEIGIHRLPITLLGTSTGFDNAPLGPTHHILDDWGSLKAIPGIDIHCPSSTSYAAALVDQLLATDRPAYLRIPKGSFKEPASTAPLWKRAGSNPETVLVTYGSLAQTCLEVQQQDPRVSVVVVNRLRPLDAADFQEALGPHARILVVEDHFPETGLYGSLCELAARKVFTGSLQPLGPLGYDLEVGTSALHFHRKLGLDAAGILKALG